jgi:hypothetical protein
MNTRSLIVSITLGAVAAQASATTFSFAAQTYSGVGGGWTLGGVPLAYSGTDKAASFLSFKVNNVVDPSVSVVSLSYSFDKIPLNTPSGLIGTGAITFSNGTSDATLDFVYQYELTSGNASILAVANIPTTVSFTNGTGWLSGVSGSLTGSFSSTLTDPPPPLGGGTDGTQLKGSFQTVPEPAGLAPLALGAIGLLGRRRRN